MLIIGPLARSETEEKGRKPGFCQELVAHFEEWTTGRVGNLGKGQKIVSFAWN